jgi:hypothetical protein
VTSGPLLPVWYCCAVPPPICRTRRPIGRSSEIPADPVAGARYQRCGSTINQTAILWSCELHFSSGSRLRPRRAGLLPCRKNPNREIPSFQCIPQTPLLVQFLRVSASEIFRDVDNLPFGLEWRAVISSAIQGCETFILFWCCHSSKSQEVKNECDQDNRFITGDDTKLPPDLDKYHGIDLHSLVGPHEERYIEKQVSVAGLRGGSEDTQTVREWALPEPRDLLGGCVRFKQELATIIGFTSDSG